MPFRLLPLLLLGTLAAPVALCAQEPATPPVVDSLAVTGNQRLTRAQILGTANLKTGQAISYRDIQRAIAALWATGQFDDVRVDQDLQGEQLILVLRVKERPILVNWSVRGVNKLSERRVKERVKLSSGKPVDRASVARAVAGIDSLYRENGYYAASTRVEEATVPRGIQIAFVVNEGSRVAVSQVVVEGNDSLSDKDIVKHMAVHPEGFWWFQPGRFDQEELDRDVRERLPDFYGQHGFIDFHVLDDTLVSDTGTGKASLTLKVQEGPQYRVGTFEIEGNRRFSTEELSLYYPFGTSVAPGAPDTVAGAHPPFDRAAWDAATDKIHTLYGNWGYIYADIQPVEQRRTAPDGTHYRGPGLENPGRPGSHHQQGEHRRE